MLSATKGTKPMQSWIHVIEWRATVRPDVPALIDDRGARYSYADLLAALERHAGGWAGLGVRPGDRVAVVAKNSADFLVHAFAILRAGATPAFINWRLSAGELAEVLALVEPAAIAADAEFTALVEGATSTLVEGATPTLVDGVTSGPAETAATELTRKVVIGVTDGGEDAIPAGWTDGRTLTGEAPPPEDR
jgi:acyl-CoA synthetase (AMP-forming)/AMP-acid ligase II